MTDDLADMRLPPGRTCGDCLHLARCRSLFGCAPTNTVCDWSPSRFHAAPPSAAPIAARGLRVLGVSRLADDRRALVVHLSGEATDDALRAVHDHLRGLKLDNPLISTLDNSTGPSR